jgi:hypothetical protein
MIGAIIIFTRLIKPSPRGFRKKTVEFARKHNRTHLRLCAGDNAVAGKLNAFTEEHRVKILNVAGPRASKELRVGEFVMRTLQEAFGWK